MPKTKKQLKLEQIKKDVKALQRVRDAQLREGKKIEAMVQKTNAQIDKKAAQGAKLSEDGTFSVD